jgi:hypothetical protein
MWEAGFALYPTFKESCDVRRILIKTQLALQYQSPMNRLLLPISKAVASREHLSGEEPKTHRGKAGGEFTPEEVQATTSRATGLERRHQPLVQLLIPTEIGEANSFSQARSACARRFSTSENNVKLYQLIEKSSTDESVLVPGELACRVESSGIELPSVSHCLILCALHCRTIKAFIRAPDCGE